MTSGFGGRLESGAWRIWGGDRISKRIFGTHDELLYGRDAEYEWLFESNDSVVARDECGRFALQ